mmetsp:Transcript_10811/g.26208  ORF Transcript_10811/g.26208 Transcript_10811/m.26208 type:complete len:256 (+) Transcript_10811:392-1159(+)
MAESAQSLAIFPQKSLTASVSTRVLLPGTGGLSKSTLAAVEYSSALPADIAEYESARSRWICPKEMRVFPNCFRSPAYLAIRSTLRRAMPQDMAARPRRSISRLRIMHPTALPSSPTRLAAGTRTLSKTSSAVGDARIPHLSLICCPRVNPLVPFSTIKSERPFSVLAYTRKTSPVVVPSRVPFVIHILVPFRMKSPPSRLARVAMDRTSVPALGSDMHIPPTISPEHARGRNSAFWALEPFLARLFTKRRECAR